MFILALNHCDHLSYLLVRDENGDRANQAYCELNKKKINLIFLRTSHALVKCREQRTLIMIEFDICKSIK